jgi:sphinganine-1-phosphate aldolase
MKENDSAKYKEGKVSGCIYLGDEAHTDFLNEAYSMFSLSNPLHPDIFPSVKKFEAEVIRMTVSLMHGDEAACGAMTSGGTER